MGEARKIDLNNLWVWLTDSDGEINFFQGYLPDALAIIHENYPLLNAGQQCLFFEKLLNEGEADYIGTNYTVVVLS